MVIFRCLDKAKLTLPWILVALIVAACVPVRNVRYPDFSRAETTCTANRASCDAACRGSNVLDSTECAVAHMLLAEEVVATGNPKQLDAAALQRLSGDLSPMCQEHIARACAAQAHLAQPIVEPKSVVDARAVMVAATAEAQRRADAEIQAVGEANAKCPSGSKDCEARCENGEPAFCLAWASWLVAAKPPRLVEAKTYFRKACDGGVRMGCALFNDADRRIQQAAAETEQWWERVEQAGDRLVRIPAGGRGRNEGGILPGKGRVYCFHERSRILEAGHRSLCDWRASGRMRSGRLRTKVSGGVRGAMPWRTSPALRGSDAGRRELQPGLARASDRD
jgi:hypothetical protein